MHMSQPIHSTAKAVVPPTLRLIDLLLLCVGLSLTLPRVALGQSTTCIPLSAKKRTYAAHVFGGRMPRKDAASAAKRDGVVRGALDKHRVLSMTDPEMCAVAANAFYAAFDLSPNSADRFVVVRTGNRRVVRLAYASDRPTGQAAFDESFSRVYYKFWR
jgi:hypothetical protein